MLHDLFDIVRHKAFILVAHFVTRVLCQFHTLPCLRKKSETKKGFSEHYPRMALPELRVFDSVFELLPSPDNPTPMVRLQKVNPLSGIELVAKLEWYNPFGSVKDRIARQLLQEAEKRGELAGKKIVEPTSGNTGIALNAIANLKGLKVRNTISSEIPQEKKEVLKWLGAELVEVADSLCPDPNEPGGAIGVAKSTAKNFPEEFYMPNQYENDDNWKAHYHSTAPEIWKQTRGKVSHFIAGLGTCGTITGCAKFLKEQNSKVKIIGVAPEEGHRIPGVRSKKQLEVTKLYRPELYDSVVEVSNDEAYEMCRRLNREEGLLCGPSSGMAVAGALKAIREGEHGFGVIVFPDSVFKYASFLEQWEKEKHAPKAVAHAAITILPPPPELQRNPAFELEPEKAREWLEKEKVFALDVRPQHVFAEAHVPRAKNIPLNELSQRVHELPKNSPILTICNRGNASYSALEFLHKSGFKEVKSLKRGTLGWMEEGLPVE